MKLMIALYRVKSLKVLIIGSSSHGVNSQRTLMTTEISETAIGN